MGRKLLLFECRQGDLEGVHEVLDGTCAFLVERAYADSVVHLGRQKVLVDSRVLGVEEWPWLATFLGAAKGCVVVIEEAPAWVDVFRSRKISLFCVVGNYGLHEEDKHAEDGGSLLARKTLAAHHHRVLLG